MNLAYTLFRTARRVPRAIAVIERDRVKLEYGQVAEQVLALAGGLQSLGVGPGDRVGLLMKNCAQYVQLLYACWTLGACAIPLNTRLHAKEVAWILDDAAARLCFVTDDADTSAIDLAREGTTTFIDVDGADFRRLLQATPGALDETSRASQPAWLFYTSGTTGRPKGVLLTHRNLLAMTLNYLADVDRAAVGEHLLHAAPMSHGSGLYMVPNVAAGAAQVIPAARAFDVDEIQQILAYTPRTKFFAAPTMVMRLVDAYAARGEVPQQLKAIIYGGGPMYVADSVRALDVLGPRLVQIYGQGESPMTITVLTADEHMEDHDGRRLERLGSVGRAQTGVEVTVLDADGRPVPAGTIGEVCVRSDSVMAGYLNNPQATAETMAGGWLHTGDLGCFDDTGYLTLVDRSRDLIISGGSNIYPREVEETLLRCPGVREVAVVGEVDAEWGEAVVAVIVASGVDAAALDAHCIDQIARFKRPKRYVFVEELPKNATGKVLKRELRALLKTRGS